MAILWVREQSSGRSGTQEKNKRSYTRTFLVKTDNVQEASATVRSASGIPAYYTGYSTDEESDTEAVLVRKRATQKTGSPYLWMVQCEYSTLSNEGEEENPDPLYRPPKVTFGFRKITVVADEHPPLPEDWDKPDKGGAGGKLAAAFTNSAGEIFDPQPTIERSLPFVTIGRWEETFYPQRAIVYTDSVNKDDFLGGKPGTVFCEGITAEEVREQTEFGLFNYWWVTYVFVYNRNGWQMEILDAGNYYIENGARFDFTTDDDGDRPPIPIKGLLDGRGGKLNPRINIVVEGEQQQVQGEGANPFFIKKEVRLALPFARLGINQVVRNLDLGEGW